MDTFIKAKKGIHPKTPVLVVGLPGIGNVGRLTAEHLIKELKGKRFAVLYSKHFPHQVVMLKNGGVRMVSNQFYLIKGTKNANDIVILTGDVQAVAPEGQYAVNKKIVKFFKEKLGGSFIFTVGGYNREGMAIKNPRVLGNATSKKVVKQMKEQGVVFGESAGTIWGSAGQIIGFAKMMGINGVCLMGESSFLDLDASAAKAVIKSLASILKLDVDTKNIDVLIDNTAKAMKELENQMAAAGGGYGGVPPPHTENPTYIR